MRADYTGKNAADLVYIKTRNTRTKRWRFTLRHEVPTTKLVSSKPELHLRLKITARGPWPTTPKTTPHPSRISYTSRQETPAGRWKSLSPREHRPTKLEFRKSPPPSILKTTVFGRWGIILMQSEFPTSFTSKPQTQALECRESDRRGRINGNK
jgi:hypothetical protein